MPYRFGQRSDRELETCHGDLVAVMRESLKHSPIDFGISEGHRSVDRQNLLFRAGKSQIDGVTRLGKHNVSPSLACDVYAWTDQEAYRRAYAFSREALACVVGVVLSTARRLYLEGDISHLVRSGADWDRDGVLLLDQSFDDMPHFELYKP